MRNVVLLGDVRERQEMRNVVLLGDVREKLREIPDGVVQTCVTSPPYFGLRDYNVSGQIGLEPTPEAFVEQLVNVFREVRRVLRDDGTLWLNLGDSFVSKPYKADNPQGFSKGSKPHIQVKQSPIGLLHNRKEDLASVGLKPKDLIGIPWRVAFALQADGWYLRSDVIWHKPQVMPESVTDRPTKSHEYIFLLTKNERYFYDAEAVKEPCVSGPSDIRKMEEKLDRIGGRTFDNNDPLNKANASTHLGQKRGVGDPSGRNRRTVWTIGPKPYKGAHFATFPDTLPEICIRAGTSEKGSCPSCGAPWKRLLERQGGKSVRGGAKTSAKNEAGLVPAFNGYDDGSVDPTFTTVGWEPTCECPEHEPVPCVVLDPFSGSGTTLAVAKYLRRDYLGVELNPEYHKLIKERLRPAEELESERKGFDAMLGMEQE